MPWKPKTWADLLSAAPLVKAANPGVFPLLAARRRRGRSYVDRRCRRSGNLLVGSKNPTMHDPKTKKWVVDSPGLRAVLGFYRTVYAEGLGATSGQTSSARQAASAPAAPVAGQARDRARLELVSGTVGVSCAAPWRPAAKVRGRHAPIPTENGQAPG